MFTRLKITHIDSAIKTSFHKFLYLSKSSNTNNHFPIFRTIIHITIQTNILFMINFQFTVNLFSRYSSLKLKNRNVIYHVHKAKTHP